MVSYNSQLSGPMPCAFGSMSKLRYLSVGSTGMTSYTECCAGMRSLEVSLAGFNKIFNLPNCLEQLTELRIISFDTAMINAPMLTHISNWTKMYFLDFNANNITGTLPSPQFCRNTLQQFYFTDNMLSEELAPDLFDNMSRLEQVELGRNSFTGRLPNFNNSNNLVGLALDSNQFTGSVPSTWLFPKLESLRAAHNRITGSLLPLRRFVSMSSVDLSYNDQYLPHNRSDPTQVRWSDMIFYLGDVLPDAIQVIQLSHNRLNGCKTHTKHSTAKPSTHRAHAQHTQRTQSTHTHQHKPAPIQHR